MTTEDVQTNIRLSMDLKERLVKVAAQNKRSLSAEVASRLKASFARPAGTGEPNDAYAQERGAWSKEMIEEVAQRAAEAAVNKVVQAHGFQSGKFGTPTAQVGSSKKT